MNNKHIAIIGTVGLPATYGGFETLTQNITHYLSPDFNITVFCSAKSYTKKLESVNGAKLIYLPFSANGVQSIPYDILSILKSIKFADTLLILGVSGCIILPFIKPFFQGKIIVNIDGLEWKRDKWNSLAKAFLKFSERIAVNFADNVIADNKVIQNHITNTYKKNSTLIAYGADHSRKLQISTDLLDNFGFLCKPYAFTVCRIEPENNIHMILEAMSQQTGLQLVMVGNWLASEYGKKLQDQYSEYAHIHLLNPIYNQDNLDQIRSNCKIYLHGHSAGGTNPSLVEAMYLGLPVIAYGVNYNKETTDFSALYFMTAEELLDKIKNIDNIDIATISSKLQSIASSRYLWIKIADAYKALF